MLKKKYRKGPVASADGSAEKKQEKKREKQPSPEPALSGATASPAEPPADSSAEYGASQAEDSFNSTGSSMAAEAQESPERDATPSQPKGQGDLRPPSVILTRPSTSEDDVDGAGASKPGEPGSEGTSPSEKGLAEDEEVFNNQGSATVCTDMF